MLLITKSCITKSCKTFLLSKLKIDISVIWCMFLCPRSNTLHEVRLKMLWNIYSGYTFLLQTKSTFKLFKIKLIMLPSKIFKELRKETEINLLNWIGYCVL